MTHRSTALAAALILSLGACSDLGVTHTAALLAPGSAASSSQFPDIIPIAVRSEGIAIGTGQTFYVGNLRPTVPSTALGAIYIGNLRTGGLEILKPNDGRPTAGMKFDDRSGYLFAARGTSGWATVVDGATGATIADLQFAVPSATTPTFVNDVIVTQTAAYFTDSRRAVLYRVPLGAGGELVGGFDVIPLSGDFIQGGPTPCLLGGLPGPLFANGIEATPNGEWLIINSLANGRLYRVDPASGVATSIDLGGGDVCLADGNLLAGHTLYVMQNLHSRIAVVELSADYLTGTVGTPIQGSVPMTTMARFGNAIYAVTAGFAFLPTTHPHQIVRFGM